MSTHLFTYGILQLPEIFEALTGCRPAREAAVVENFARYCVRDACYPGMVAEAGGCTCGYLYRGVDAFSLELLDRFEGPLYERQPLSVRLTNGCLEAAHAYVVPAFRRSALLPEPWDFEAFRRQDSQGSLEACREFRAREMQAAPATAAYWG